MVKRINLPDYARLSTGDKTTVLKWVAERGLARVFSIEEDNRGVVWVQHYDDPPVAGDNGPVRWLRNVPGPFPVVSHAS